MLNQKSIKNKIIQAPDSCGVYLMFDASGRVIYVGKANSLRERLSSYWAKGLSGKTAALMQNVFDIKYKLTVNEASALLLEAGLIHKLKPKYNVSLRDDKSFPYVFIGLEKFPRIFITRKKNNASGRLLGPYTNAKLLKDALKSIRCVFPFRSCATLPKKACIYFRINLCPGPCIGKITQGAYKRLINKIILCLEGATDRLIRDFKKDMRAKSRSLDFEASALLRDRINVLSLLGEYKDAASQKNDLASIQLKEKLSLDKTPRLIEGFDISNLSGTAAVGSLVSFLNAYPDKNNYRRFRIKSVSGIDDYAMLSEVLRRRYARLLKEGKTLPDLVVLDGGKGHLETASRVFKEFKIEIPLLSIAKEHEHIYICDKSEPLKFTNAPDALNLIRRIRDEAHRFAVAYHHLLRQKKVLGKGKV